METDKNLQNWNNRIEKAMEEYLEFEKKYTIFWANILDIVNDNALDKEGVKYFCDELYIHNTKLRKYLYEGLKIQ